MSPGKNNVLSQAIQEHSENKKKKYRQNLPKIKVLGALKLAKLRCFPKKCQESVSYFWRYFFIFLFLKPRKSGREKVTWVASKLRKLKGFRWFWGFRKFAGGKWRQKPVFSGAKSAHSVQKWSKNAFLSFGVISIAWFSRLFSFGDIYEEHLAQNGCGGVKFLSICSPKIVFFYS